MKTKFFPFMGFIVVLCLPLLTNANSPSCFTYQAKVDRTFSIEELAGVPYPFVEGVTPLRLNGVDDRYRLVSHGGIDPIHSPTMIQLRDTHSPKESKSLVTFDSADFKNDPFGEGITVLGQNVIQLGYLNSAAYVWPIETLLSGKSSYHDILPYLCHERV